VIPQPFIQDLLSRVDIAEVVGRQVDLKKAGINLKGLCPFHGEKSPSFIVSPSRQTYHCFGCGAHGDAIRFLMENAGMKFNDAVQDLAQQVGMQVPEDDSSPEERERANKLRERQATLTDVLERAAEHFRKQLRKDARAVEYLKNRGLTGEIAAQFGLGYAADSWRGLASVFPRYDDPLLEESGLVIRQGEDDAEARRYDRFRDRIMFPIRSVQGEVIGFGGRVLDKGEPKYLNSPETPVFIKGRELYGLHEARTAMRQRGYALVVEGYMDVVALAQMGLGHAVATLGTACTAEHMQKLFRFTDSVVFSFDGDAAGRRAAGRALEAALPYATDTRTIRFLFLPPEHDPDSFVREHGAKAFDEAVALAVPLSRQLIEVSGEGCDLATAEGRAKVLANARPMWHALPDGALRRQLFGDLAQTARLSTTDLTELWESGAQAGSRNSAQRSVRQEHPGEKTRTGAQLSGPRRGESDDPRDADASSGYGRGAFHKPARTGRQRMPPASNMDHVMRMLLLHSQWWDLITPQDHELLHGMPEPHGPLCAWLERQLADHGPVPWSALAGALHGDPLQATVERLVPPAALEDEIEFAELRSVLDRLWIEQFKNEETQLIAASRSDPAALVRYREVYEKRRRLEQTAAPSV
jgi:DNA primase